MYEKTFNLKDDELPASINARTGEITELKRRQNNIPDNKEIFNPGFFNKTFSKSWDYLLERLKPVELKIIVQMGQMARMNSNSLAPLNEDTKRTELSKTFNIDRNQVKRIFDKLFKMGIYAEFKFTTKNNQIKHYWVLNPYISFKGRTIDRGILDLFRESKFAELNGVY